MVLKYLKNDYVRLALIVAGLVGVVCLLNMYLNKNKVENEGELSVEPVHSSSDHGHEDVYEEDDEAEEEDQMPGPGAPLDSLGAGFDGLDRDELKHACFPVDQELTADDLLPQNEFANWADAHPSGVGSLKDKNFLHAGHHIGINTVGQSLRNPNYGLRSEPSNPQVQVSPWQQTTVGPDNLRRPLEINGCQ